MQVRASFYLYVKSVQIHLPAVKRFFLGLEENKPALRPHISTGGLIFQDIMAMAPLQELASG